MGGTRHGVNATNHSVYSMAERMKDKKQGGYGKEKVRLGKDAVKGFDCCSLTLQPTKTPCITPQGYIFCKEAILTFIIEKKKEYAKKLQKYEEQLEAEKQEFRDTAAQEEEDRRLKFEATEKNIVTKRVEAFRKDAEYQSIKNTAEGTQSTMYSNQQAERKRHLPAFWMPAMGPQAKKTKLTKPDKTVYCPISRQPLRAKDLVDVQWTLVRDPEVTSKVIARKREDDRYQCAVTGDTLYDSTPAAVLRPTGHVVTQAAVEKIVRKDMRHPLTGQGLKEKDIINIQRGATGFAAANDQLVAEGGGAAMSIG